MMSINLAQATKDPKRMADAVEQLLSLGWPGNDEAIRRDARQQVEKLAKTLREERRGDEADALLARLPRVRGTRPLHPPVLDGRRRPRPVRRRAAGRHGQLLDPAHGLRRLDRQERLRQAP